jgi:sporulation protein YlmC with PRC-barrel domain
MNKTVLMLALISFLSVGLIVSSSYAAGTTGKRGFMMLNSSDLIGASVRDYAGEFVGIVNEVMIDSGGHAFAIINHGDYGLYGEEGANSPVPFEALRISQTKSGEKVVFKMDAERLDFGPYLDPTKPFDRQREADIYLHYGIEPYWTANRAAGKEEVKEFNSHNLISAAVENSCGKVIGIVNEVLVDSEGHAFLVINHGDYDIFGENGVNTPVPFQELQISKTKRGPDVVFLKTDTEHLDFAPYLGYPPQTKSRQYEASIYEYYGIAPYWMRSGELSK